MTPKAVESDARTLPHGLAPLVEALELEQIHLITTEQLEQIRRQLEVATPAKVLAARLRERGWLLKTARRGVYEFAPGAHAGALSRGDATLALQSVLTARPDLVAALTLQSAAWALGAADRLPQRLEVAAGTLEAERSLSRSLGQQGRVTRFAAHLPHQHRRGVPVLSADSVLVHMAAHPRDVRSWSSALEWLPDLAAEATPRGVLVEIKDRPLAVTSRLAYLLSGLRPDLARQVTPAKLSGKVYFGERGPLLRHDHQRQVADTLLPFDPRTLDPVT